MTEETLPSTASPLIHLLTLLDESEACNPSATAKEDGGIYRTARELGGNTLLLCAQDSNQQYVSSDTGLSSREKKALVSFSRSLFKLYETALCQPLTAVLEEITEQFVTTEYLAKISRSQEEAAERQANINELVVAAGKYRTGQRLEDPWVAGGDLLELNEGEGELELEEMVENEVGYGEE